MKSCRWYEDRLGAYVDRVLSGAEMRLVWQHLGQCQSCRQSYEELRRLVQALSRLPSPEAGVDFWPTMRRRLRAYALAERSSPGRRELPWPALLWPALAAAVVAVLLWNVAHNVPWPRRSWEPEARELVAQHALYSASQPFAGGDELMYVTPVSSEVGE